MATTPTTCARRARPDRRQGQQLLEADGELPIEHLTPHTLRRSFASILALFPVDFNTAKELMGHTSARLTFDVYSKPLKPTRAAIRQLEDIMGCRRDEACDLLTGLDEVLPTSCPPARKKAPAAEFDSIRGA